MIRGFCTRLHQQSVTLGWVHQPNNDSKGTWYRLVQALPRSVWLKLCTAHLSDQSRSVVCARLGNKMLFEMKTPFVFLLGSGAAR
eukprot:672688-Lingulodinium_polyedra.AAC.1